MTSYLKNRIGVPPSSIRGPARPMIVKKNDQYVNSKNSSRLKILRKGVVLERMTLTMVDKIAIMVYNIVRMFLQVFKLKKEVLTDLVSF